MIIEKVEWVRHPQGKKVRIWSTKALREPPSSSSSDAEGESDREGSEADLSTRPKANGKANGGASERESESMGMNGEDSMDGLPISQAVAARMPQGHVPSEKRDPDKLLAVLATHNAPVNCVRWSYKGQYLASASDDRFIIIWEKSSNGMGSSAPFGTEAAQNVENWSQLLSLQGHTLDVIDVAWSYDDQMLASASLDNKVIVWHIAQALASNRRGVQPHRELEGHNRSPWTPQESEYRRIETGPLERGSQVKGVAWDPVGRYLASSGQDQTLIVWRTSDWSVEARVTKPFEETAKQESLFRRISWSPDGSAICATNASKSSRHVAALIRRGTDWSSITEYVGHDRPVVATRFSPVLYQERSSSIGSPGSGRGVRVYVVHALGDDNSGLLTVWSSAYPKPRLILRDVFQGTTTDISWARDGSTLLACSLDGTVCYMTFEKGELGNGKPMSQADLAEFFRRTYGTQAGGPASGPLLRENAMVLPQQQQSTSQPMSVGSSNSQPSSLGMLANGHVSSATAAPSNPAAPRVNILQARPKDGKKRIRPQLMSSTAPGGGASHAGASIVQAKRQRVMGSGPSASHSIVIMEKEKSATLKIPCPYAKAGVLTRIVTDFAGFGSAGYDDEMGSPSISMPPVTVDCSVEDKPNGVVGRWPISRLRISRGGRVLWREAVPGRATTICGNTTLVAVGCADSSIHTYGATGLRLCPAIILGGGGVALLECSYQPSSTTATHTEDVINVDTMDDDVDEGQPPQHRHEGIGHVKPDASFLMAISTGGDVRVWDLYRMRAVVSTSLRSVMDSLESLTSPSSSSSSSTPTPTNPTNTNPPTITRAEVLRGGVPRLELAAGNGAVITTIFDRGMDAWVRVGDSRYALSDFSRLAGARGGGVEMVTMSTLLRSEEEKELRNEVTRAHLEDRLASAVAAGSRDEVIYNLRLLVARLSRDGDATRLKALCERLMGRRGTGAGAGGDGSGGGLSWWRPERRSLAPGVDKREMLSRVVLPAMDQSGEASPEIQRLIKQYKEAMDSAGAAAAGSGRNSSFGYEESKGRY